MAVQQQSMSGLAHHYRRQASSHIFNLISVWNQRTPADLSAAGV